MFPWLKEEKPISLGPIKNPERFEALSKAGAKPPRRPFADNLPPEKKVDVAPASARVVELAKPPRVKKPFQDNSQPKNYDHLQSLRMTMSKPLTERVKTLTELGKKGEKYIEKKAREREEEHKRHQLIASLSVPEGERADRINGLSTPLRPLPRIMRQAKANTSSLSPSSSSYLSTPPPSYSNREPSASPKPSKPTNGGRNRDHQDTNGKNEDTGSNESNVSNHNNNDNSNDSMGLNGGGGEVINSSNETEGVPTIDTNDMTNNSNSQSNINEGDDREQGRGQDQSHSQPGLPPQSVLPEQDDRKDLSGEIHADGEVTDEQDKVQGSAVEQRNGEDGEAGGEGDSAPNSFGPGNNDGTGEGEGGA